MVNLILDPLREFDQILASLKIIRLYLEFLISLKT